MIAPEYHDCADVSKFAAMQVPEQIFITDKLPKGATGKIQRRHMVGHFIGKGGTGGGKLEGGVERKDTASGKPLFHSKL